eukprot:8211869-Alexandrium_andersonii.AAC.1
MSLGLSAWLFLFVFLPPHLETPRLQTNSARTCVFLHVHSVLAWCACGAPMHPDVMCTAFGSD